MEKLVAKLKVKLREHAKGIAGYQFLAACKLFRSEVAPGQRKGGRISAEDFRRVVEYKFGMKLDPDEVLTLFHFLVPGAGDSIEIAAMVRERELVWVVEKACVERACARPVWYLRRCFFGSNTKSYVLHLSRLTHVEGLVVHKLSHMCALRRC